MHLIGILIALSFLTFLLMYLSPGDAASKKLSAQGVAVSEEVLEKTREEMGLNRPFFVQYLEWLLGVLKGNLGTSYKDGLPVSEKIGKALGFTVSLALGALALSLFISLPLSILTAVKKDSVLDYVIQFLSFIGNSLPNFLIAVLLMYFLCVRARLFPVIADRSLKGLFLPSLSLAIPMTGRFIRQFRAAPQDPAKNVGLRIVSGTAAEMRYITLLDCNIVILRFSGSDETFS